MFLLADETFQSKNLTVVTNLLRLSWHSQWVFHHRTRDFSIDVNRELEQSKPCQTVFDHINSSAICHKKEHIEHIFPQLKIRICRNNDMLFTLLPFLTVLALNFQSEEAVNRTMNVQVLTIMSSS